jgi:SAM-dependent MidA family methyltransferase
MTAPELGDWLAAALAPFLAAQFATLGATRLLELGAGTGQLAADLLRHLAARGCPAVEYSILEPSADLRERQQARLAQRWPDVRWLDRLPATGFRGIVLANEVADAVPVMRFVRTSDAALPLGIVRGASGLAIAPGSADARLDAAIAAIETDIGHVLPVGYCSEVCLQLKPWLDAVLGPIEAGGLLLIDYGLSRRDYYSADRRDGTLICHYRQRAHDDALRWPGLQDISAWVDFSAAAEAGGTAGCTLSGFTTQAQFLIESIARDAALASRQPTPREASALKTLILPGEMGERFKLLWLTRGLGEARLPGRDFRSWL